MPDKIECAGFTYNESPLFYSNLKEWLKQMQYITVIIHNSYRFKEEIVIIITIGTVR